MSAQEKTLPDLTLAEAARKARVATSTMREWVASGRVPAFRTPGGTIRIRFVDLLEAFRPAVPAPLNGRNGR